jgi:hypothetical protein
VTEITVATPEERVDAPATERAGPPGAGGAVAEGGMPGTVNVTGYESRPDVERGPGLMEVLPVVSDDVVAGAPFLLPEEGPPPALGRLTGFAGAEEVRAPRSSARLYDRMTYEAPNALPVGSWVQAYRPGELIPGVGRVAHPTGLLEIEPVAPGAPVARVRVQYLALGPGDLLRAVPAAGLAPGVEPVRVADGPHTLLVGVARDHELQTVGDFVFLGAGLGSTAVGDEWVPVWPTAGEGVEEGRVQVVLVQDGVATARITNLVNPVFRPGITMRLLRRMPGR